MNANKLSLYRENKLIGHLENLNGTLKFSCDSNWNEEPIYKFIPLNADGDSDAIKQWFRQLLPSSGRRRAFEWMTKLSFARPVEFLLKYGEDLAGDLSIKPRNEFEETNDITKLIHNLVNQSGPAAIDHATVKSSLSGNEAKIAVIPKKTDKGLSFHAPNTSNPSTHILKSSYYLIAMEDHATTLAKESGLFVVSNMKPIAIEGIPFLLIERFDRKNNQKIAMENFCQLTGKSKYESYGDGASMEDMANVMLEKTSQADIQLFLKMSVFMMLIGNGDDHAANYSLLYKNNKWEISPCYDIVSSAAVKKIAEYNPDLTHPDFANLDLNQARCFGADSNPFKIKGRDISYISQIFQIDINKMQNIFEDCIESTNAALNSFADIQLKRWRKLNIKKGYLTSAETDLEFLRNTVKERIATLEPVFAKAFDNCEKNANINFQI